MACRPYRHDCPSHQFLRLQCAQRSFLGRTFGVLRCNVDRLGLGIDAAKDAFGCTDCLRPITLYTLSKTPHCSSWALAFGNQTFRGFCPAPNARSLRAAGALSLPAVFVPPSDLFPRLASSARIFRAQRIRRFSPPQPERVKIVVVFAGTNVNHCAPTQIEQPSQAKPRRPGGPNSRIPIPTRNRNPSSSASSFLGHSGHALGRVGSRSHLDGRSLHTREAFDSPRASTREPISRCTGAGLHGPSQARLSFSPFRHASVHFFHMTREPKSGSAHGLTVEPERAAKPFV